jgi:transposase
MNKQMEPPPELGIPEDDWAQTPDSVKLIFMMLYEQSQQVEQLKEQMAELQEQVNRNSKNSSQSPSSDGPGKAADTKKQKGRGRKRGGQKGHTGHQRQLVAVEEVDAIVPHKPEKCIECGGKLEGEDPEPYRYQVTELPPVKAYVIEHQVHKIICPCCGKENRGELPPEITVSQFGSNLVALVALLMGVYRLSKRQVKGLLKDCFEIKMATGSVVNQQSVVSQALAEPVDEARGYVQEQAVRNVDETGWYQHDQDKKSWLWVVVTPMVTGYKIALSRAGKVAKDLVGEESKGIVGSDRFSAYNWLANQMRQICWAHLLRDFQQILERGGASGVIGRYLRQEGEDVLALWSRIRDGTLSHAGFRAKLPAIKDRIHFWLTVGESCSHKKTSKTCDRILKVETALWTFVTHSGVEPTNNSAERALRKAVIWRKISYGTQSDAGSRFVERILTTVETCRQQDRNPLDYLQHAIIAHRTRQSIPSLLPDGQVNHITP